MHSDSEVHQQHMITRLTFGKGNPPRNNRATAVGTILLLIIKHNLFARLASANSDQCCVELFVHFI